MRANFSQPTPFFLKSILLVLFLLPALSFSQTYYFDNYSVKDGLAQSKVYAIVQDSEGYLWLGTESGASRFDGVSFRNFTTMDSLSENGVRTILEDASGNIWFGHTGGGISRYRNGKMQSFDKERLEINGDITSLFQDNQNNLWIGSHGGGAVKISSPDKENLNEIELKHYKGEQGLSDRVFSIVGLKDGKIYFLIDNAIKIYNPEKDEFEFFRLENLPTYFQITVLFEDSKENLWFGTYNGGLYKYSKNKKFEFFDVRKGLAFNWISAINEDAKGNVWVGTWGGGISRFENGKFTNFNSENGLKDNKIWSIISDREGNVIIGTNENGFLIFKGEQFVAYTEEDGIINSQIWAIVQDKDGRFWFGTNEGISIFDPKAPAEEKITNFTREDGLVSNHIRFLKRDHEGNIWIGTADGGVQTYIYDKKDLEYNILINRFIRQDGLVTAMEIDKNNDLWVGTIDGLIYFDIDKEQVARLTQSYGLAGNDISALFCDQQNIIWVGSKGKGLTSINDTIFTRIELDGNITPTSINQDKDGKIWIGTQGQGVLVCDGQKIVQSYKMSDGLLANYITLVETDQKNNIYLGTNRGLNKLVQSENKIYTYTEKSGFTGIEVKNNSSHKDRQGNIWFGTVKGAMKFKPTEERVNQLEPLTHITRFRVNLKDRKLEENLELDYNEKSITFDYSSICLTNPDAVRYKVMLEGADESWRPETDQTYVTYSPLPPGKYTFKVKAKNNSGVWNQKPVTYSFEIKPPFWQTWWFYLILAIVGITGIILYVKIRERNLIREKRILEEKVAERTAEVVQKNEELAKKNKDITDSIRYAKRIQDAILPSPDYITQILPEHSILFKPRDIVSGDFYWMTKKDDKIIVAAADCTGHGVPGAFMSMLGVAFLNEIVNKPEVNTASEILNMLRQYVIKSLQQTGKEGEAQDGMDISLIIMDLDTMTAQFSGAYNALYIIRAKDKPLPLEKGKTLEQDGYILSQIPADRMPIGIYSRRQKDFVSKDIKLLKGDRLFLFSDGYHDQFGGQRGGKFLAKNMKRLLIELQTENMSKHKEILDKRLRLWQGEYEQVDDILVIGIEV